MADNNSLDRQEVLDLIDKDIEWIDRNHGNDTSIASEVLRMEKSMKQIRDTWENPKDAIDNVIELAALCIRCLENHGKHVRT